jgi:group I intron endonuclease
MKTKCGVYKIIGPTGKIYIGSSNNIDKRWVAHRSLLNNNKHVSTYLQNSWNKYGEDNFKFKIIEETLEDNLINREQYYLDYHKSYNQKFGYNILKIAGSTRGWEHSTETKQKISQFQKGRKKSKATKEKFRQRMLGTSLSEETKEKLREYKTGTKHSEESKKKLSDSLKKSYSEGGRIPWQLGKNYQKNIKKK